MMKVDEIGIFDAKTKFSEIIQKVEEGKTFIVTKRGKRVAAIAPVAGEKQPLVKGSASNSDYWMAEDFNETPVDFEDEAK